MGLHGNLKTMSVADLLQWAGGAKKSGTLHLSTGSERRQVCLRAGQIISASSNHPREFLGHFLLSYGKVTEEELLLALETQRETRAPLGRILTITHLMDDPEVHQALSIQVLETVFGLFLWTDGRFEFREGELPDHLEVEVQVDPVGVVMEGTYRADEWQRMRRVFASDDVVIRRGRTPSGGASGRIQAFLQVVGRPVTVGEVLFSLHALPFQGYQEMFALSDRGLIESVGEAREQGWGIQEEEDPYAPAPREGVTLPPALRGKVQDQVVPIPGTPRPDLSQEPLPSRVGYLYSRIDGRHCVRDLMALAPFRPAAVVSILRRLEERGWIRGAGIPLEEPQGGTKG